MKTVSIITVVYNNEYIGTAIQSVLQQDYPNIEYIVIDGASTDGTMDIIKSYGSRINKVLSEPDKGIYDAINKGIGLAGGDIIGILNADDFFADSQVISRMSASFNNDPALDAVYADVVFTEKLNLDKITRHYSSKSFRPWMFKFGFQPAHPTFYAKRQLFEEHGQYQTGYKIAGDFELLLRFIAVQKIKVRYINDVWVKMRQGGVSTSGLKSILRLNAEIKCACIANGVYTNTSMIYAKYMVKWWGFLFNKQ